MENQNNRHQVSGKIVKGIAGFYYVCIENGDVYECKAKGAFRNKNIKPYVKANLGYSFNLKKNDLTYSDKVTQSVYDWYDDAYDTYDYTNSSASYDTKIKNGIYYGIGGGVQINNVTVDLMYQANYAKAKIDYKDGSGSEEHNLNVSRVTLGVGYAFQF